MIKFALRCGAGHVFDSWFRDSEAFDRLAGTALACPTCGSTEIVKALMAPAVVTSRGRSKRPPEAADAPPAPQPATPTPMLDDKGQALRDMLRDMRDHLVRHSRDVGPDFAEEARRIHERQLDESPIRGVASPDEVKALLDDGIEIMPLPVFPDERN